MINTAPLNTVVLATAADDADATGGSGAATGDAAVGGCALLNHAPLGMGPLGVCLAGDTAPPVPSVSVLAGLLLPLAQTMGSDLPLAGTVLWLAQTSGRQSVISGSLLRLAQRVQSVAPQAGMVLQLAQSTQAQLGGLLLRLGQTALNALPLLPYSARGHIDGVPYQIRVMIGAREVDPCRLFKSMSITHRENESATAELQLREPPGVVDLYEFYNQQVQVLVQTAAAPLACVYSGIIDVPQIDLQNRKLTLTASHDRTALINQLSAATVAAIGHWAESIFGERKDYKTQAEEVADRMTTIPASLDFDAAGQMWLAPWQPKAQPDMRLGDCDVYARQISLAMGSAVGLVNTVNIKLANRFERLLHRQIGFSYHYETGNVGQLPCWIAWEGPPPKFDDVWSAANGAGWGVGGFKSTGTPKSGYYDCGGTATYFKATAYEYDYVPSGKADDAGNQIMNVVQIGTDGETSDLYCLNASWQAAKRWRQNVEERYTLVISNAASVQLHGKKEENLSYTITHDADKDRVAAEWEELKTFAAPYGTRRENGDYVTNIDNVLNGEYARAWTCAFNIGYTKMLESHRNNTLTLQCKFIPGMALRYTVGVAIKQFAGAVKVREYTHHIDFVRKQAKTEVVGAFFKNPLAAGEQRASVLAEPPKRPVLPVAGYQADYVLGNYVIPHGAKIINTDDQNPQTGGGLIFDNGGPRDFLLYQCQGYVRKETGYTYYQHKIKRGYAFRVVTPDIENASRDTLEQEAGITAVPVFVFDTPVKVML